MDGKKYFLVGGTESCLNGVFVRDIQRSFVATIQSYMLNNPVEWIGVEEVRDGLREQIDAVKRKYGPEIFVVTLSSLYFPNTEADAEISGTRMVGKDLKPLGLTNRPGSPSLMNQIADVMSRANGRKIVVVDDTLFHGHTIQQLRKLGLRIDAAVEYFTAPEAETAIEAEGISVFSAYPLTNGYKDVMPLHDFMPILPLSGKVVGVETSQGLSHMCQENGLSCSIPYLMPYIDQTTLVSWASIPWDNAQHFSSFALSQTMILAERLRQEGILTLEDLRDCQPHRVSNALLNGWNNAPDTTLLSIATRAVHHCMV